MELTVLGSSGSYPTATNPCSGYLLRAEGTTVWMDAGNGTLVELQKHAAIAEVDAVVLSHVHPDHCVDLYPFFFAILFADHGRAVPVLTPPGVRARLEHLIGKDSRERFARLFDWREAVPGDAHELGPLRIEVYDAAHSVSNNTLRITHVDRVLCYSGDTGPNEHLAAAARGADLFLCEASWSEAQRGIMEPIHLTASEAGAAARDAGAARLLLTHLWADNDPAVIVEQAGAAYDGDIALAMDAGTVQV